METKILSFQKEKNLSIILFATSSQDTFNYISAGTAIKQNLIEVKEISDAGSVNNILVINHSQEFVFFSDGDVLLGAKQNRVLNTAVLLAPNSQTKIPVSCVEQGRWHRSSFNFNSANFNVPTGLRMSKARDINANLKNNKVPYANQGKVWHEVKKYSAMYDAPSYSSDLGEVFYKTADTFDNFINRFKNYPNANGISVFIRNKLLNIDIFNRKNIFAEYFSKLLKSAAVDAYKIMDETNPLTQKEAEYKTLSFLDKFEELKFDQYPGVGVGTEKRFETNELTGFELNYKNFMIYRTALGINGEIL